MKRNEAREERNSNHDSQFIVLRENEKAHDGNVHGAKEMN